ncbi:MAG: hypothetical protein L0Y72_28515 [Gemmataceae bacterium]|nr:hypothetical protein [Gemmataceae bacterium]MCI0742992.1 hypothetical protein [Gemmataceae bacterium]
MIVANLQAFLRNLAGFLSDAGGGKHIVNEFDGLIQSLEPFQSMKLTDWCALIQQAQNYRQTGILPVKVARARKAAQPAKSSEDLIREATQLVTSLYQSALDAGFRYETVDSELAGLLHLRAADLKKIALEFGLVKVPRLKIDILDAIAQKIKGRRAFHERTQVGVAGG